MLLKPPFKMGSEDKKARKKPNSGILMLFVSFFIGILSGMSGWEILTSFLKGASNLSTLKVIAIVILIGIIGGTLHKSGSLARINNSLERFIKNRFLALIFPSLLMGVLPVPAGAMLSAPLVEESGNKIGLTPEVKTFLNYWFRHIFEFIWPIYPGIILAATILNIPVYTFILTLSPVAIVAALTGIGFGLKKVSFPEIREKSSKGNTLKGILAFFLNAWPIVAIVILVLIIKLDIVISLFIIAFLCLFTTKPDKREFFSILKESLSVKTITLIIAVMIFKQMLESSGLLPLIPLVFEYLRIPKILTLFAIPFFTGITSGLALVVAGVSFPILLPLMGNPLNLTYVMFAYTAGVAGYLLSPIHLCLVTTIHYFKADTKKVYRLLLLPVVLLILSAFIIVFLTKNPG